MHLTHISTADPRPGAGDESSLQLELQNAQVVKDRIKQRIAQEAVRDLPFQK